jgi:hypothetical protein
LLLVMAIVCPESIENFQETALKTAQWLWTSVSDPCSMSQTPRWAWYDPCP